MRFECRVHSLRLCPLLPSSKIEYACCEVCVKLGKNRLNQAEGRSKEKKYRERGEGLLVAHFRKHQQKSPLWEVKCAHFNAKCIYNLQQLVWTLRETDVAAEALLYMIGLDKEGIGEDSTPAREWSVPAAAGSRGDFGSWKRASLGDLQLPYPLRSQWPNAAFREIKLIKRKK